MAVIALGIIYATAAAGWRAASSGGPGASFERYRNGVGRAILLGLELLVAADIIRSIVVPTFRSVGVLAIIVLIRTFLSFTLEVELTGRWPWQHDEDEQSDSPNAEAARRPA